MAIEHSSDEGLLPKWEKLRLMMMNSSDILETYRIKYNYFQLTLKMFRTAHELNAREQTDPARQQHSKRPQPETSLCACAPSGCVPLGKLPASALVVDVVEEAAFRHQQRVRLEWTFCDKLSL